MNKQSIKQLLFINLFIFLCLLLNAQGLTPKDVVIDYAEGPQSGLIVVRSVTNNYKEPIKVQFLRTIKPTTSSGPFTVQNGEKRDFSITCNIIEAQPESNMEKWVTIKKVPKPQNQVESKEKKENDVASKTPQNEANDTPAKNDKPQQEDSKPNVESVKKKPLSIEEAISGFNKFLESKPFLSSSEIKEEKEKIEEYIVQLKNWENKDSCIQVYRMNSYIESIRNTIKVNSNDDYSAAIIRAYLGALEDREISNRDECVLRLRGIINERLAEREKNIARLSDAINDIKNKGTLDEEVPVWWYIGGGAFLLLIILVILLRKSTKKSKTTSLSNIETNEVSDASSAIVIRKKTTTTLKKQSLDNVVGNNSYMEIDCADFCEDSAIRKIYIKNTCIKDIYNMYAEDLRNPNNPKEDGCMVLGRWVHNESSNEYDVSLEQIVLPGDDAVFSEYELNFGGKIKLKVTEKLRKLRRETDLQYDLTCWVHSHPGLGVFFSNSDSNVQMQLKHPSHPNFLTAMVIDILTPEQELGIFTFKHDSSINSKAELKKLYSLEEMYKWAIESERSSFNAEDYYNTLENVKFRSNECFGIELSNGAIIDMGMLVTGQNSGLAGMIHGYSKRQGAKTEHIVSTVSSNESVPDNELIGCFIIASHCSIPSIRKAVSNYLGKIKFVFVYTTTDDLLTSIPVMKHDICTDENSYGEQKLEDLKIWTRRKR